jgi:fatty acid desaturase
MSEPRTVSRCPLRDFQLPDKFAGHPGGQCHISEARASDSAGIMFLSYHSATDMEKVAAKAKVLGIEMPEGGSIFDDVCGAIRRVQAEHPWQRLVFKVWCFAVSLGLVSIMWLWLCRPSFGKSVAVGLTFEMYFFNVFHMRHHMGGKLFKSDLLNDMFFPLYTFLDYVWGYRPPAWHINHHTRHHIHTNTDKDPDIPGSYPGIRCSEDQPLQWFHKYQTFYVPLVLPIVVPMLPVYNLLVSGGSVGTFIVWLGTWWTVHYLHGWYGVGQYCLLYGLTSFSITYKFLISHVHPALGSAHSDPSGAEAIDVWMRHQIEEAMTWGGYIGCFFFGGINTQIEHHISPALTPTLHPFLRPRLQRICEKHGIKYIYEPTMLHAVWQFHKHLWVMGQRSSPRS